MPTLLFIGFFLFITALCFIKFRSLRNYRKKWNWLLYVALALIISLATYEAYNFSIGPAIISYQTAANENHFYNDRTNQLTITCQNLGNRATSFNLIVRAVNASLTVDSQQGYVQINSTAVKIPFTLQTQKETQNRPIKFTIDQNVATFNFYFSLEPQKSNPLETNSYSQLHCQWNSFNNRYEATHIYAPSISAI